MHWLFLSLCFFLIASANAGAQHNTDSLWAVWSDAKRPDTVRLKALHEFARDRYMFSRPDSAFYYLQKEYDFAESRGLKKFMADALNTQGGTYHIRGDYSKALDYYLRSLEIRESIGDKNGIASSLNNIGLIYQNQGDNLKALEYYQRTLKYYENLADKRGMANTLSNIGNIFQVQVNYPKSLEYYGRSLKIREDIGDKNGIANSLGNIGVVHKEQKDYDKALEYLQQALKIEEELDNKYGIGRVLGNIGSIYIAKEDFQQALDFLKRASIIQREITDLMSITFTLIDIGTIHTKLNKYEKAIGYCKEANDIAISIGALDREKDACRCLYDVYKRMKLGMEALYYHEQMLLLDDNLHKGETTRQLERMEFQKALLADSIAKADQARLIEEAHREEVRRKNQTQYIFMASGLFLLLIVFALYSRNRYIQRSKVIIEKERDRSDSLLLNILPAEIAQELKDNGTAKARDFETVSILFTDFKGFTEMSSKLSAAKLVDELNHCFKAFDGIMEKYGIEKIKTIGDAYMAAGGLPIPTADSTKNTVLAALEMQKFIIARKSEKEEMGEQAFQMRVGVHTGPVVAGIVGVKKFQYDIWGDTVNTASRMESNGEIGKVNISQNTYELLKDDPDFVFESRGKIAAKGKGEVDMWFVSCKII